MDDPDVKTRVTPLEELRPLRQGTDCLVVIYSSDTRQFGKRYVLEREVLSIGRGQENTVVLDNDSVSRRHCRIEKRNQAWYVCDLDSTNGTYVNDELVKEYQLRRGDQVKIGDTIVKYLSGSDVEAQYHEAIHEMAIKDGLTNVHNKRYLMESLEREIPRAMRHQRPLSVVMFDIDFFKKINDTYGHLAGDYVLKEFATLVKQRPAARRCLRSLRRRGVLLDPAGDAARGRGRDRRGPAPSGAGEALRLRGREHLGDGVAGRRGARERAGRHCVPQVRRREALRSEARRSKPSLYLEGPRGPSPTQPHVVPDEAGPHPLHSLRSCCVRGRNPACRPPSAVGWPPRVVG